MFVLNINYKCHIKHFVNIFTTSYLYSTLGPQKGGGNNIRIRDVYNQKEDKRIYSPLWKTTLNCPRKKNKMRIQKIE